MPSAGEPPAATDLLRVIGLRRSFGGVNAVADISFSVPAARITGLIGPNGAGKTTTVAVIAGDIRPTQGRVVFRGQDVTRQATVRRARAGLIRTFQLSSEFKRLTVLENLLVAVRSPGEAVSGALLRPRAWQAHRAEVLARATELLERYGLRHKANVYAGELSSGQKRLVEIMRALMARPRLLLLDEPMAGVHPAMHGRIEAHLRELCDSGLTMLMVEHELSVVERCCSRVIVMARGVKIAEGTMSDVRANDEVQRAYLA
jgi:ABC-type branched-subunit amino acid transport system ATPase component